MPWTLENGTDCVRLTLTGAVDVFEAKSLHRALVPLSGMATPVHIDLAGTSDLDSSILQLLLALRRTREAAGRPLVVEGAAGRVQRLVTRFMTASASPGLSPGRPS